MQLGDGVEPGSFEDFERPRHLAASLLPPAEPFRAGVRAQAERPSEAAH